MFRGTITTCVAGVLVAACGDGIAPPPTIDPDAAVAPPATDPDAAPPSVPDAAPPIDAAGPGADETVIALSGEHVYFGAENRREVDVSVQFPPAGPTYERITLHLGLGCPSGGCDWWDRLGWLSIVDGDDQIEVLRFITPYRVAGEWSVDVTDLRPLLSGERTLRVFIDTWVGPGHANGEGWLVDAAFEFEGGVPAREAIAVIPVWSPHPRVYGDPSRPIAATATAALPPDTTAVDVRAFVTGHGQGNADNCAEFCARTHTFTIDGADRARSVWRDDCAETAVPGQQGTWQYARAGWCPGATVHAIAEGVDLEAPAAEVTLAYDVETYENTCRPGAPVCTGCVFGTGCDYNGGSHTEPAFWVSAALIAFR